MNRTIATTTAIIIGIYMMTDAALGQTTKDIVSTNSVSLIYKVMNLEYEYTIDESNGVSFEVYATTFGKGRIANTEFQMYGLGVTYNQYMDGNPFNGPCLALRVGYFVTDYNSVDSPNSQANRSDVTIDCRLSRSFSIYRLYLSPYISYLVSLPLDAVTDEKYEGPLDGGLFVGLDIGVGI